MDQVEIINEAVGYREGEKNRGKRGAFLESFNERMAPFTITRQTFCKWGKGHGRPEEKTLRYALTVYPAGDPRHAMAAKLLEVCYGGNDVP